jgi:aryl sulfotransferase
MTTMPSTAMRPTTYEAFVERHAGLISAAGVQHGLQFRPRSTDVIITPFGKCGTTWLQQIFHGLRTRGDMDFDDISRVVPWIETAVDLGLDLDAPQRGEPRGFKSHLPYDLVPKGARYIVSVRDPKDAFVSSFRFMEGWFFETGSIPIETFARRYLTRNPPRDYWHHLTSWWPHRGDDNVLMLSYESMKADLAGAVRAIAGFVGIELDDALFDIVMRQSSLEFMLAHKDRFDDRLMRERSERVAGLPPGSDSTKVRSGRVGEHARELPAEISAAFDRVWREAIEPTLGFPNYAALNDALTHEREGKR